MRKGILKGRVLVVSAVILGGLLATGAGCREPGEHESSEGIPATGGSALRRDTPPTSRELFVFRTVATAEALATTQGLRVAPPQESGAGVVAPSRVEKGERKRRSIKESFLAEAGRRVAKACGLSMEDVELIYRRGIEERWPHGTRMPEENEVLSRSCG